MKNHPYKNQEPWAREKFKQIAEAYDVLSDRKSDRRPVGLMRPPPVEKESPHPKKTKSPEHFQGSHSGFSFRRTIIVQ